MIRLLFLADKIKRNQEVQTHKDQHATEWKGTRNWNPSLGCDYDFYSKGAVAYLIIRR